MVSLLLLLLFCLLENMRAYKYIKQLLFCFQSKPTKLQPTKFKSSINNITLIFCQICCRAINFACMLSNNTLTPQNIHDSIGREAKVIPNF